MVGRQTPILAVIVPLILVFVADGKRGVRETWVPALVAGLSFGIAQFIASNYISVPLTAIVAALVAAGAGAARTPATHPPRTGGGAAGAVVAVTRVTHPHRTGGVTAGVGAGGAAAASVGATAGSELGDRPGGQAARDAHAPASGGGSIDGGGRDDAVVDSRTDVFKA